MDLKALLPFITEGSLFLLVMSVALQAHWRGGPGAANRMALAMAAASRHPGIAGLIVHHTFDDQRAMLAVLLFLLNSVVISAAYRAWHERRIDPPAAEGGAP